MEHLNRLCKYAMNVNGKNYEKGIVRLGKIVGPLNSVLDKFDDENSVIHSSPHHCEPSTAKDYGAPLPPKSG